MAKNKLYLIGIMGMAFCSFPLSLSAGPVTKSVARRGIHAGELMKSSRHIGRSTEFGLRSLEMSVKPATLDVERVLTRSVRRPRILPLNYWSSLPEYERPYLSMQLKTPGFLAQSFSYRWEQYLKTSSFKQEDWSSWLADYFRPGTKFRGYFVLTLRDLQALAERPVVDGVSAQEALEEAFIQAEQLKYGFLAIAVGGSASRAREVFIMNLEEDRWIPFNKSKGKALAAHFGPLVRLFHGQNLYLSVSLGENKILVRIPEGQKNVVETSVNGLVWKKHDVNSPEGEKLFFAMEHELVIGWDARSNEFLFSAKQAAPSFSTPQEALLWQRARAQQIPVNVEGTHLKLYFPATEKYKHVFYRNNLGDVVCVAGQPLTPKEYDNLDDLSLIEFIKEKLEMQDKKVLFLYTWHEDPLTDTEKYLQYLSRDLQFSSGQLEEVVSYEKKLGL